MGEAAAESVEAVEKRLVDEMMNALLQQLCASAGKSDIKMVVCNSDNVGSDGALDALKGLFHNEQLEQERQANKQRAAKLNEALQRIDATVLA